MIISKDGEEFTVNTTNEEIEVILYFPKLSTSVESEGSMTDKGLELIKQAREVGFTNWGKMEVLNGENSTRHKSQSGETHPKILDKCMVFNNSPMDSTWFKTLTNEALEFREDRLSEADQERQREANKGLAEQEVIKNWESPFKDMKPLNFGKKETADKADYSEINLGILDLMADRFSANKGKYEYGNSKKPLDKQEILWALFRHVKKMVQPIEDDEESFKEHLAATLTNCSIILDQLELEK